jgi:hypothetical protein
LLIAQIAHGEWNSKGRVEFPREGAILVLIDAMEGEVSRLLLTESWIGLAHPGDGCFDVTIGSTLAARGLTL